MRTDEQQLLSYLAGYFKQQDHETYVKISNAIDELKTQTSRKCFFKIIAMAPRWAGKATNTQEQYRAQLAELNEIFHTNLIRYPWQNDQLARLWIILAAQTAFTPKNFALELDTLFNSADTNELVALYRSLPFLVNAEQFNSRAREGARSNMIPIFLAIAHNNTYASDFFDDEGWNQLILKAMFNDCRLAPVLGLTERNNLALAVKLVDYVRERWVAKRSVPFDIWRCIGKFAKEASALDLFEQALCLGDDPITQQAAVLALHDCRNEHAASLLKAHSQLVDKCKNLTWQHLTTTTTTATATTATTTTTTTTEAKAPQ